MLDTGSVDAPITHINVHIRDSSALLLHQEPGYTIYETREGPYALLVSLNAAGTAFGTAYVDDCISFPPGPSRSLTFQVADGTLNIESKGEYAIQQKLETITVLARTRLDEELKRQFPKHHNYRQLRVHRRNRW